MQPERSLDGLHGVIPILKKVGMTSHDVVAKARKILGTKKIGHSGTLDPAVSGVLPLLVGNATRLSDYFMNAPKTYRCVMRLGYSTDTQDATGEVVSSCNPGLFEAYPYRMPELKALIAQTLCGFEGEIVQIPPDYSAVKVGGKKLIDLARKGKAIAAKPERRVTIYHINLLHVRDARETGYPEVEFDIVCSKGTYVRTICHDVGELLGIKAHMKSLVRLESGGFTLGDAIPLEMLRPACILSLTQSAWKLARTMPYVRLHLDERARTRIRNGVRFDLAQYLSGELANASHRNNEVIRKFCPEMRCDSLERRDEDVLVFSGDEFVGIARWNASTDALELAKLMNLDF